MSLLHHSSMFFFFNDTATTEIYTLSLHDALPICTRKCDFRSEVEASTGLPLSTQSLGRKCKDAHRAEDRKSTRLNSSHSQISYAVFCLKKKKKAIRMTCRTTAERSSYSTLVCDIL